MSSGLRLMLPSGQNIQHSRQWLHLVWSMIGRNVLHEPVFPIAATVGYDIGVTGRSFMVFGVLFIEGHYCLR